jgi:hypothetical protein
MKKMKKATECSDAEITALFFDGRIDLVKEQKEANGRFATHKSTV